MSIEAHTTFFVLSIPKRLRLIVRTDVPAKMTRLLDTNLVGLYDVITDILYIAVKAPQVAIVEDDKVTPQVIWRHDPVTNNVVGLTILDYSHFTRIAYNDHRVWRNVAERLKTNVNLLVSGIQQLGITNRKNSSLLRAVRGYIPNDNDPG